MASKCALPSTFALLVADDSTLIYPQTEAGLTHSQQMSRVLTLSTVALAVGKLVLGFAIDRCGGVVSLQSALAVLSMLMLRIATATRFQTFALSWIFADFFLSACWPASIKAIHEFFPPHEWIPSISMLATALRIGNAMAFSSYAMLLKFASSGFSPSSTYKTLSSPMNAWRYVFGACSLVQLLPIILLFYFGRQKQPDHAPSAITDICDKPNNINDSNIISHHHCQSSTLSVIKKQLKSVGFWLHLISRSCLMVFISYLLFVPTYMKHAFGMTSSAAAQVGSIFALGCLLSVTTGSKPYSSYTTTQRSALLSTLLGLGTIVSFLQWAHVSGQILLTPAIGVVCMFFWGFTASLPFYIPPSLYALEQGGAASSATISVLFDFFGFLLLARFNGYVASITHATLSQWKGPFLFTTVCSFISLCSLTVATFMEGRNQAH